MGHDEAKGTILAEQSEGFGQDHEIAIAVNEIRKCAGIRISPEIGAREDHENLLALVERGANGALAPGYAGIAPELHKRGIGDQKPLLHLIDPEPQPGRIGARGMADLDRDFIRDAAFGQGAAPGLFAHAPGDGFDIVRPAAKIALIQSFIAACCRGLRLDAGGNGGEEEEEKS